MYIASESIDIRIIILTHLLRSMCIEYVQIFIMFD